MIVRCRFCGEKIRSGAEICEHCGKTLINKTESDDKKGSLVGLDSWQQKSVPTWLMYLVVAIALLSLVLMFTRGCQSEESNGKTVYQIPIRD